SGRSSHGSGWRWLGYDHGEATPTPARPSPEARAGRARASRTLASNPIFGILGPARTLSAFALVAVAGDAGGGHRAAPAMQVVVFDAQVPAGGRPRAGERRRDGAPLAATATRHGRQGRAVDADGAGVGGLAFGHAVILICGAGVAAVCVRACTASDRASMRGMPVAECRRENMRP